MKNETKDSSLLKRSPLGGVLLIILGFAFLLGQFFDVHIGHNLWPLLIIVPGLFLFAGALAAEEEMAKALAIISGIFTMMGAVLLVQSITSLWASWSYAWALVAPTGPGVGLWLLGTIKGRDEPAKSGKDLVRVGLVMFVLTAVFFELILGISGFGLGNYGWPLLLIVLGLYLLVRNARQGWRKV